MDMDTGRRQAWSDQNIPSIRPYVSDGVYERFSLQVDVQKKAKTVNHLDDISVDSVVIADIYTDDRYDTIDIFVTATGRDYTTDESGTIVSGSRNLETWSEKWIFMRSITLRAVIPDKQIIHKKSCPNCGAPLDVNAS